MVERLIRYRAFRIGTALALVLVALWSFLPYAMNRIASSAVVNAELVRLTAPISGRLAAELPRPGDLIDADQKKVLIEAVALDQRHLGNLTQQASVALSRIEQLGRQLRELASSDSALKTREAKHGAAVIQRLEAELREAEAEVAARAAEEEERRLHRQRQEKLADNGFAARMRVDEAKGAHDSSRARRLAAEARVARTRADLAAARQGIYIQDAYNDAPYSTQQRDRLTLRRQELEAELLQEETKLAQLKHEIDSESTRMRALSRFETVLPRNHVVWSLSTSPGTPVIEGQPIIDLADCSHRFVAVELPERHFDEVRPGDRVNVRMIGGEERFPGTVRQVRGSAARSDERLLAARILAPAPRHITVEVAIEQHAEEEAGSYCGIGRLAEVRFERRGFAPLAWISQAIAGSR